MPPGVSESCASRTPWRYVAAHYVGRDRGLSEELTDIYEFGVFSGISLAQLRTASKVVGMESSIGSVWALDSFVGLQEGVNQKEMINPNGRVAPSHRRSCMVLKA